ncbi:MAG: hypothetical protein G01um101413_468 [Parcubacteria group bacterium Gr01-1014_13]|nr:MAG: hypothetical protein G01um101413_468 [Parcubacteria group bacterium Gr01-1014_13]
MHKIPRKFLYIIGGVILLGVIAYSVYVNLKLNYPSFPASTDSSTNTLPESGAATSKKPAAATNVSLPATKSYLDAIKIYKNTGYYFQFVSCHGSPGTLTLKKGTKFMLDNRDPRAHKIAITGGQSFNIKAYGFAIATAPSTLGTHYITCDGGGAATITVQK